MVQKDILLKEIIRQYICTASPIGSKLLCQKSAFNVSSATIRNAMAELEKDGLITQPHTSAGRVPTEKGYRFYLANLLADSRLPEAKVRKLRSEINRLKAGDLEENFKTLAKKVAELVNNAVVVGFSPTNVYYTGMANLFSQPEFSNQHYIYDLSLVIDHLDKVMEQIFEKVDRPLTKVGSENPFGNNCSIVLTAWQLKRTRGIFGILGPMRMDYELNLGIINFVNQQLS